MGRGKRYDGEPKLNMKKVFAVITAIALIVLCIIGIKNLMSSETSNSLVSTSYFLINKDNKWGVVDSSSNIVIEPTYTDSIIIPNNKRDLFICTYDTDYETGTYKTKVLNSKNQEILKEYKDILPIENYDKNNNLWYEDNVLKVKNNEKYGVISFNGSKILDSEYDDIYAMKGTENSLITVKNGKLGLVNNSGKVICENKYQDIISLGEDTKLYIVKENDKYGIEGILDCKYEEIKPLGNKDYFYVKEAGVSKVIDKNGEVVLNENFDDIDSIKDDIIVYKNKDNYYAYDIETKAKTDKGYKELRYTSNNLFITKGDNGYGIIDFSGETKIEPRYLFINYYADFDIYDLEEAGSDINTVLNKDLEEITKGIVSETNIKKSYIKIWTEEEYKYYNLDGKEKAPSEVLGNNNLFLSKKDNKYGFVDKNGNVVVEYIYDDAREQNDYGYIAVKSNGLWGCLDKNGKEVCEAKYNLDNNILIDFIGEYHLGIDVNLMYYTNR